MLFLTVKCMVWMISDLISVLHAFINYYLIVLVVNLSAISVNAFTVFNHNSFVHVSLLCRRICIIICMVFALMTVCSRHSSSGCCFFTSVQLKCALLSTLLRC